MDAANNNMVQFDAMRKALNTASIPEIRDLIHHELVEWNNFNKIELKKPDGEIVLLEGQPRHYHFAEILQAVNVAIPVALIGPAGSGKSTVCKQVADALNLKYYLQNSVSGVHELAGYMDAHGKYHGTTFRYAFEHGGLVLLDEVDTSDPGALKWLNTALANNHAMFPDQGDPIKRHPDFRMIIAANTYGTGADRLYVGANQLDASTLDRFVFFDFGYDEKLEFAVAGHDSWVKRVQSIRKAAQEEKARIVVSPRASIYGSKLLNIGWDIPKVEERVIWKGIDKDLKERILKHVDVTAVSANDNGKAKVKKAA